MTDSDMNKQLLLYEVFTMYSADHLFLSLKILYTGFGRSQYQKLRYNKVKLFFDPVDTIIYSSVAPTT